jgi:dipeptidyl aminopeptidase/acylaminoacyl peptidase
MCRNLLSSVFTTRLALALAFLFLAQIVVAQLVPAPPPIADPHDTRFAGATEDWTTPALNTSRLKSAPPLIGYRNVYPGYTVELLQVQWRFGDPLDLYVMKPAGVKKPPVIIYLYGYPMDTDPFKSEKWQQAATKEGFAAVGFVSALTGHR